MAQVHKRAGVAGTPPPPLPLSAPPASPATADEAVPAPGWTPAMVVVVVVVVVAALLLLAEVHSVVQTSRAALEEERRVHHPNGHVGHTAAAGAAAADIAFAIPMQHLAELQARARPTTRRRRTAAAAVVAAVGASPSAGAVSGHAFYCLLDNDPSIMSKVSEMFQAGGYTQLHPWNEHIGKWDVLWAWQDPFYQMPPKHMGITPAHLKSGQLVNRFPSVSFTTKSELARDYPFDFIPKSFMFPEEGKLWAKYAKAHRKIIWVRKNTGHRGVLVTSPREATAFLKVGCVLPHQQQVLLTSLVQEHPHKEIFIQRFVYPPHLIGGHKWDIGVYVLVTSLNPLRVYYYDDLLLRFCTAPFGKKLNPKNVDSYVIADDYTSPWDFRPFQQYRGDSVNVKQWMDAYFARAQPKLGWKEHLTRHTTNAIRKVIERDRDHMLGATKKFVDGQKHFFELFRFDFVFDNKLNPFLMEVNMSPNLSPSAHPPLSAMFTKILSDLSSIVGLDRGGQRPLTRVSAEYERAHAKGWIPIESSVGNAAAAAGTDDGDSEAVPDIEEEAP